MDKAILVIDMPKGCYECPLAVETGAYDSCCITGTRITSNDNFKFPWCPLKPVPEKIDVPDFDDTIKAKNKNAEEVGMYMYDRGHYRGYNLCIDKILNT